MATMHCNQDYKKIFHFMDLNYLDYELKLLIINIIDNIAVILTVIYSLRYNDRQCSLTQSKEYNTKSYRLCYQGGVY